MVVFCCCYCCFGIAQIFFSFFKILLHQESGSPGMVSTASGEYTAPADARDLTWIHCFLIGTLTNRECKTSNSRLKLSLMKNSLETTEKRKDERISRNETGPYVLSFLTSNGLAFRICFVFGVFFPPWVFYLFVCSVLFLSVWWLVCFLDSPEVSILASLRKLTQWCRGWGFSLVVKKGLYGEQPYDFSSKPELFWEWKAKGYQKLRA